MFGIDQNPQSGFETEVLLGAQNVTGLGESVVFRVQNVETEEDLGTVGPRDNEEDPGGGIRVCLEEEEGGGRRRGRD